MLSSQFHKYPQSIQSATFTIPKTNSKAFYILYLYYKIPFKLNENDAIERPSFADKYVYKIYKLVRVTKVLCTLN